MRLPVAPKLSTKDGVQNKNARLTNCLKEVRSTGEMAAVRPGLSLDAQASGIGNGIVSFNNELVSVYGATLGLSTQSGSGTYGSWTRVPDVLPVGPVYSVAYGHGNFMLTNGTEFFRSSGGIVWSATGSPGVNGWALCSDGSNFIAAGINDGEIYLSVDNGATWANQYTLPGVAPMANLAVHFDGSYYLIGIEDDDGDIYLVRSADGVAWSSAGTGLPASGSIVNFATGNGVTVISVPSHGWYVTSDNGATFSGGAGGGNWVAFGNGTFLGSTGADVWETPDGLSPSFLGTIPYGTAPGGLTFDGSVFVAIAAVWNGGDYVTSVDGAAWTLTLDTSGAAATIRVAAAGNGVLIAGNSTAEIIVLNGFGSVINPLATVLNQKFDFCQSPL